jgi:DNA-binding CsgD family transcriptional regulator
MRLAESAGDTISFRVHIIVAGADITLRRALEAELSASGWAVAERCDSAGHLRERLEEIGAEEAGELLVVTGPGWQRAEALARIALSRGVPVTVWPQPPASGTSTDAEPQTTERRLTDREREVLEWVAAGVSNKGIARRLGLSPNTVKFHIAALLTKLGASTRAEAVAAAARRGELSL